jgi:hypothetical protein
LIEARALAGEPIRAELSRISPFLAEESFTTVGEIDVDNRGGKLRPGMFVNVRILVGQSRRATLVPASAVWEDPASGKRGAFVVTETDGLETPSEASLDAPSEARPALFRPVEVLAEGRGVVGVTGIDEGEWVVTVGQHLLAEELEALAQSRARSGDRAEATRAAAGSTPARVRPVAWEQVLELQLLQDEDLLEGFLDKQRKVAAALGAEIPESEDAVDRVLRQAAAAGGARDEGD